MPPKVTKKQVDKITTEVPSDISKSELYILIDKWASITHELTSLEEKRAPLEKKRDEIISEIAKLRNKSSIAINIEPYIILPTSLPNDIILEEEKPVKKTTKGKSKTTTPIEVEVVVETIVKKPTPIEDEVVVDTIVKKPTKKTAQVKETPVVVAVVPPRSATKVAASKVIAPKSIPVKPTPSKVKGKTSVDKLEEDSEENITKSVNKINDLSSSDTDIESLSSCSSDSECSRGEDD